MAKKEGSTAVDSVFKIIKDNGVKMVDLKFVDFPGTWQHFTVPVTELSEDVFENGLGFDGSSIRGWKAIHESDMLIFPDAATVIIDPFCDIPTLSLVCDVFDPLTKQKYERDPRNIAHKAEAYLKQTGIADTAYFGPEAEFFILDDVRYDSNEFSSYYFLDSSEGKWNTGRAENPNLGYKIRHKEGYFPVPPADSIMNLRNEMTQNLIAAGLHVEAQHHEVATAGQSEIDLRYSPLLNAADGLMLFKYIIKNTAHKHNKTVTYMPKPIFGDNGSGMHVHQSLWKNGKPLFFGNGYANLSDMALHYIAGLLKHAPALCALTNPTTNSYKRLVPGFEAPVNLAYSQRNRSASVRIPAYSQNPKAKRVEYRTPDASCNPYLAFSALMMAGLDGILNKLDPGDPLDKDIYDLSPEELKNIPSAPGSLDAALKALEHDHDFLLKGDVFTEDAIDAWIDYKMTKEVKPMALRPHPYEFHLYFDV
jgi:glutamine synthetase